MEDFLRRIKLIEDVSTKLNITTPEFVSALRKDVEEADIDNVFSGLFEAFSSNKKKYKGMVDSRGFHIRTKRKFFEKRRGTTSAKGTFRTNGDSLIVNTSISAISLKKLMLMSFLLIGYFTFFFYGIGGINTFNEIYGDIPVFFIVFIIAIPLISYFSLKREVANMKKDLQEQFHSISSQTSRLK